MSIHRRPSYCIVVHYRICDFLHVPIPLGNFLDYTLDQVFHQHLAPDSAVFVFFLSDIDQTRTPARTALLSTPQSLPEDNRLLHIK